MNHYLIVFDREEGRLLRLEPFESSGEALRERFQTERFHQRNPRIEIVVLSAQSEEVLRHTHARYFKSMGELAADGLRHIAADRAARQARAAHDG